MLIEQLGGDVADARNGHERCARVARLLLRLRLAADVETPAGQARRQADVLPLFADRERELVVGDDHFHGALVLVHDDLGDLRRRERAADVLRLVGGPWHDVDLLAAELLHDRLHARTAHADARADRIDIAVVGVDGDLRAPAGLARRALHLDDALVDLRHLLLEELDQQSGMRA